MQVLQDSKGLSSPLAGLQGCPLLLSFSLLAAAGGEQKEKKKFFGAPTHCPPDSVPRTPAKGWPPFAIPQKNREVDAKEGSPTSQDVPLPFGGISSGAGEVVSMCCCATSLVL